MINSFIRNYKAEIVSLVSELQKATKGTSQKMSDDLKNVEAALKKSRPSLMFYGIYNSGKSTLLNAIFGDNIASVNDVPETHKVTSYSWNGYELVDTPGLNGPKEDEVVTMNEINKHDIIMFVIDDSDNFDSDVITRRIVEILEARKPCIIVINKKNDSSYDEILVIKEKMSRNIATLSKVTQNYDFIAVDAKSALRARREDKKTLLEDSDIKLLESCITKKLHQVSSIQLLRTPIELSIDVCEKAKKQYKEMISNSEVSHLNELLQRLYYVKAQIVQEFNSSLQTKIYTFTEQIYQQARDYGNDEVKADSYMEEISNLVKLEMTKFAQESKTTLDDFSVDWKLELSNLPDMPDKPSKPNIESSRAEYSHDEIDGLLDLVEIICRSPIMIPLPEPIPVPVPIVAEIIRAVKNFLFGPGQKKNVDLDEWNQKQEEYAEKRELALRELRNRIEMNMTEFQQSVLNTFNQQFDKVYENSTVQIRERLEKYQNQDSEIVKKQKEIAEIESRLQQLEQEIKGA